MTQGGTLIAYYYVCKRKVWLASRELGPDPDNYFLEMGRIIHDSSYRREKKEIELPFMKFDLMRKGNGGFVVGEIKKSSRFLLPAKMQLAFYLLQLKKKGVELKGELLIPREKKRIQVELSSELEEEVVQALKNIREIIKSEIPPPAEKIRWCKKCAYSEFCWADLD